MTIYYNIYAPLKLKREKSNMMEPATNEENFASNFQSKTMKKSPILKKNFVEKISKNIPVGNIMEYVDILQHLCAIEVEKREK